MLLLTILGAILAAVLLYILFLAVCSLLIDPKKEYETHSPFYRHLLNTATAIILKLMRVRIHTTGLEQIPTGTKKLLFVGNHRSNFDPLVSWHVLKAWQPAFLSKAANFKIPIFGRFIRKCCFMTIDRENPRNAYKTVLKAAALLEKEEVSIGVYPEGTRSKDCQLLPFHNGVFKIAQKGQASIVVLAVQGTEKIHKNYPLRPTDVYLDVLAVIPPETVHQSKTEVLGAQVRELLAQGLSENQGKEE